MYLYYLDRIRSGALFMLPVINGNSPLPWKALVRH